MKQWTQGLSDSDYQLPILLLIGHIPDRDIPNFLFCPFVHFSYKLIHQSLEYCKIVFFFNSNKNLSDLIPADATLLSVDFFLLALFQKS